MALRRQLLSLRQQALAVAESASAAPSSARSALLPTAPRLAATFSTEATAAATAAAARRAAREASPLARLRALLRDYKQLSKFRLSALVVATSAAGYAAASPAAIDWAGMGWTCLGTMLASSSANALNQAYEIANDARMRRTMQRPLPAGRMTRAHALVFAAVTGAAGVALLASKTNATTAGLGAANIALYAGVYTPLKQLSVVNTWVGAVVGAVPPLMGWAAASGSLDVGAAILAAGLYFWQMPHFMALAWMCRADYAAGGYRMLSMVDPTGRRTAACALRNAAALLPLGALATWLGVTTPYFAYESAFITGGLLLAAARFRSAPSQASARLLFRASLLHLPIFMAAFLAHRVPNTGEDRMELLAERARELGLMGTPALAAAGAAVRRGEQEETAWASMRLQMPPMPFLLPVPHLRVSCPSKAMCAEAGESGEEGEEEEEEEKAAAPPS